MARTNPRDVITRHQVYLERLKAGYVKDYDEAIREADQAILEILRALDLARLSEISRKGLKKLLSDLQEAQAGIYGKQADSLMANLSKAADSEALFEQKLIMDIAAGAGITASVAVAKQSFKYAKLQPVQATGDMLEDFVADLSKRQIARINKEVLKSVAQGRTISQTVQAVRGTKARNFKDGIISMNSRDARTIVRTATQHVSQSARAATWEANSDIIDSYQIIATLDGRTSTQCKSLDQMVFEIGKGPQPPFHPNCRTTTVPYFKPSVWDEGATRSALFGPVDSSQSYYDWLGNQTVAFQDDAIGPIRGKLFRDGGLSADEFSRLQLDKNFQPITLEEMQKLSPRAFEKAFPDDPSVVPKKPKVRKNQDDDKLYTFEGVEL